jgi:hypothetical protein
MSMAGNSKAASYRIIRMPSTVNLKRSEGINFSILDFGFGILDLKQYSRNGF